MEIDYVKVWQLKPSCSNDTTISNYYASTYDNKLYRSITMNNGVSINNQPHQSFWGSDHILLNASGGNITFNNSNILFNVTNCSNILYSHKRSSSFIEPPPASFTAKLKTHY
jgi:hypothetical protein